MINADESNEQNESLKVKESNNQSDSIIGRYIQPITAPSFPVEGQNSVQTVQIRPIYTDQSNQIQIKSIQFSLHESSGSTVEFNQIQNKSNQLHSNRIHPIQIRTSQTNSNSKQV